MIWAPNSHDHKRVLAKACAGPQTALKRKRLCWKRVSGSGKRVRQNVFQDGRGDRYLLHVPLCEEVASAIEFFPEHSHVLAPVDNPESSAPVILTRVLHREPNRDPMRIHQ